MEPLASFHDIPDLVSGFRMKRQGHPALPLSRTGTGIRYPLWAGNRRNDSVNFTARLFDQIMYLSCSRNQFEHGCVDKRIGEPDPGAYPPQLKIRKSISAVGQVEAQSAGLTRQLPRRHVCEIAQRDRCR